MASQPIWRGTSLAGYLLETVEASIEIDQYGISKASETYLTKWRGAVGLVLQKYQHQDHAWLYRKTATITREEADMARVTINYEGVPPSDQSFSFGDRDGKDYSLSGTVGTSPIETHPNFDGFAGLPGTAAATANGVIYETDAKTGQVSFKGFAQKDGDGNLNPLAGVKTYLEAGLTYEMTSVHPSGYTLGASLAALGYIDDPPNSPILPSIPGRDWLLIGVTAQTVGSGVKITKKWRLSGVAGWNTDIYGAGGTGG